MYHISRKSKYETPFVARFRIDISYYLPNQPTQQRINEAIGLNSCQRAAALAKSKRRPDFCWECIIMLATQSQYSAQKIYGTDYEDPASTTSIMNKPHFSIRINVSKSRRIPK
mmetsp:Transcript_10365/g.24002  ORF Transcript_10365/g.24002 Transcript_10365/m.24002 type:complete len:113 (-) Transcript_10365:1013-1351(-)